MKIRLPYLISNTIEDIYLFYINIKNAFYNFFHFIIEVFSFYTDNTLRKVDIELFKKYAIRDQFTVAVEESRMMFPDSKEELTYGEAMWKSIDKVMKYIKPLPDQKFYDLGCGTGRICFLMGIKYQLKATGIELLPTFIDNARRISHEFNLDNISFVEADWLEYDFTDADIIYIAATCLENDTLELLKNKLEGLKKGTYIVSVSHQMTSKKIQTIKKMYLPFSWGKAEVFISKCI